MLSLREKRVGKERYPHATDPTPQYFGAKRKEVWGRSEGGGRSERVTSLMGTQNSNRSIRGPVSRPLGTDTEPSTLAQKRRGRGSGGGSVGRGEEGYFPNRDSKQ